MRWLALWACTGAEDTAQDPCGDAPVVTYETFGAGFLTENCNACHAVTSANRNGAPDDVHFDTVEEAWSFAPRILARSLSDPPGMPPEGGTTADDLMLLEIWLTCAANGT